MNTTESINSTAPLTQRLVEQGESEKVTCSQLWRAPLWGAYHAVRRVHDMGRYNGWLYVVPNSMLYGLLRHARCIERIFRPIAALCLGLGNLEPLERGIRWCGRKIVAFEPRCAMVKKTAVWRGARKVVSVCMRCYRYLPLQIGGFCQLTATGIYASRILEHMPDVTEKAFNDVVDETLKGFKARCSAITTQVLQSVLSQWEDFLVARLEQGDLYQHIEKEQLIAGLQAWFLASVRPGNSMPEKSRYDLYHLLMYRLSDYRAYVVKERYPAAPAAIGRRLMQIEGVTTDIANLSWSIFVSRHLRLEDQREVGYKRLRMNSYFKSSLESALRKLVTNVYRRLPQSPPSAKGRSADTRQLHSTQGHRQSRAAQGKTREPECQLTAEAIPALMEQHWIKDHRKHQPVVLKAELTAAQEATFRELPFAQSDQFRECLERSLDDLKTGLTTEELPRYITSDSICMEGVSRPVYRRVYQSRSHPESRLAVCFTIENGMMIPLEIGTQVLRSTRARQSEERFTIRWKAPATAAQGFGQR